MTENRGAREAPLTYSPDALGVVNREAPRLARRDEPTRLIEPPSGVSLPNLRALLESRDLFLVLVVRDIRARYAQTALGIGWVILQPLVPALLFAVILGALAAIPSEGKPYLLFALAGLVAWNVVATGVARAAASIVGRPQLVTKVYVPRLILPLASVVSVVPDLAIGVLLVVLLSALGGVALTPALATIPLLALMPVALACGVGLWVAALNVYYRDFAYAVPFIVQAWLFASPVVYSKSLIPASAQTLYALNPMVGITDAFRWALLGGSPFPTESVALALVGIAGVLVSGYLAFGRLERHFADII